MELVAIAKNTARKARRQTDRRLLIRQWNEKGLHQMSLSELRESPYLLSQRLKYEFFVLDGMNRGQISDTEVIAAIARIFGLLRVDSPKRARLDKRVRACLRVFDTDGDGYYDMLEFVSLALFVIRNSRKPIKDILAMGDGTAVDSDYSEYSDSEEELTDTLLSAVRANSLERLDIVIAHSSTDVNETFGKLDTTALYECALINFPEGATALLQVGADIEAASNRGWTPVMIALWQGHFEIVNLLVSHGAQLGVADVYGNTALHAAARGGVGGVMEQIINAGVSVDSQNDNGETALHFAVLGEPDRAAEVIPILTGLGAELLENRFGKRPDQLTRSSQLQGLIHAAPVGRTPPLKVHTPATIDPTLGDSGSSSTDS